jgi:hypothetical protein
MGDYSKDLKKFLRENGCTFERQGKGDHESGTVLPQHLDLSWIIPLNQGIRQIQFSNKPDYPKNFKPNTLPPNNYNKASLTPNF